MIVEDTVEFGVLFSDKYCSLCDRYSYEEDLTDKLLNEQIFTCEIPILLSNEGLPILYENNDDFCSPNSEKATYFFINLGRIAAFPCWNDLHRYKNLYREVSMDEIAEWQMVVQDTDLGRARKENPKFWGSWRIKEVPCCSPYGDFWDAYYAVAKRTILQKYKEMTYKNYIQTKHWIRVREERLKLDGYQCKLCGSAINLNVHHITYENKGNEDVKNDLITLCKACHNKIHGKDNERKMIRCREHTMT